MAFIVEGVVIFAVSYLKGVVGDLVAVVEVETADQAGLVKQIGCRSQDRGCELVSTLRRSILAWIQR